jgi:hypothetical protein
MIKDENETHSQIGHAPEWEYHGQGRFPTVCVVKGYLPKLLPFYGF